MRARTPAIKQSEIEQNWYEIDASGKVLGRLASYVSDILQGKNDVRFVRGVKFENYVVITNASKVKITGKKADQKMYYRHSGYTGNLKSISFSDQMKKDSSVVITKAVKGMLPSNTLGRHLLKKLKVARGSTHSHAPQKPVLLDY